MENTCVLTHLPVVPNWKIYNSVSRKPIKYCTILKEKREFQNLLENFVSKNLKNSCSIIDKKIDASKDKKNLEIVFLNHKVKNFLSLYLVVSKNHVLRRRNNLLIFLKNNANDLKYHIQDNNIYVKCDTNIQWHIFYKLFEFLLVKYGICNIGAIFYCMLFSGCMLKQERRFLCCNPILASHSSSSSFFNLHKINSDLDLEKLNYTCKKLPKRSICNQNSFNDSFALTDSQELTFKIMSGSEPNEISLNDNSVPNGTAPKQKIPRMDCLCSEIHCKCHELEWKLHKNISKYNVTCYMDILLMKGVTSTDELSIAQGESSFTSAFRNFPDQEFDFSLNNTVDTSAPPIELPKINDLPLNESQSGEKCSKNPGHQHGDSSKIINLPLNDSQRGEQCLKNPGDQHGVSTLDAVHMAINNGARYKLEPHPESLLKAINLLNEDADVKENFSFLLEEFTDKKKCTSSGKDFNMFQTASGKKVNISDTAMKAAEKMFTEVMQSEDDLAVGDKNTNVFADNKLKTKNIAPTSVFKTANYPEIKKEKHLIENIDGILVDNFFDDVCFDEKDEGLTDATQSSMCTNKFEKSSIGKVRKSLGGRRSLKPYSVPKS